MTLSRRLPAAALAAALAFTVAGCVGPPVTSGDAPTPPAGTTQSPSASEAPDDDTPSAPVADSCDWDSEAVAASAEAPTGEAGALENVLIGSWQHTHFDSGDGWEPASNDLRYVFVSTEQLLFCQHVPGITEHAENRAAISLEGNLIQPPSPHPGFEVLAYSADRMLWLNNFDGSQYLLVRR